MDERPERIDIDRIEFVGGVLLDKYGVLTGCSRYEDNRAGDMWLYKANTERQVDLEIKTVKQSFQRSDRLYPLKNPSWYYVPWNIDPSRRYWLLNALNSDGTLGKGMVMRTDGLGLAYLFLDGILYYSPSMYRKATEVGLGLYKTSQRSEFETEKRKETLQAKVLVDLESGKWIPCNPPKTLFEKHGHEDFNKRNAPYIHNKNNAGRIYIYG